MPGAEPERNGPADGPATTVRGSTPGRRPAPAAAPGPAVLPEVTADERDVGWGELPEPADDDRYLREVPPHHGT